MPAMFSPLITELVVWTLWERLQLRMKPARIRG